MPFGEVLIGNANITTWRAQNLNLFLPVNLSPVIQTLQVCPELYIYCRHCHSRHNTKFFQFKNLRL